MSSEKLYTSQIFIVMNRKQIFVAGKSHESAKSYALLSWKSLVVLFIFLESCKLILFCHFSLALLQQRVLQGVPERSIRFDTLRMLCSFDTIGYKA